jgi:hypothetical protein
MGYPLFAKKELNSRTNPGYIKKKSVTANVVYAEEMDSAGSLE